MSRPDISNPSSEIIQMVEDEELFNWSVSMSALSPERKLLEQYGFYNMRTAYRILHKNTKGYSSCVITNYEGHIFRIIDDCPVPHENVFVQIPKISIQGTFAYISLNEFHCRKFDEYSFVIKDVLKGLIPQNANCVSSIAYLIGDGYIVPNEDIIADYYTDDEDDEDTIKESMTKNNTQTSGFILKEILPICGVANDDLLQLSIYANDKLISVILKREDILYTLSDRILNGQVTSIIPSGNKCRLEIVIQI